MKTPKGIWNSLTIHGKLACWFIIPAYYLVLLVFNIVIFLLGLIFYPFILVSNDLSDL